MTNNYEGSISFVPIKVSSPPNRQILAYQIFTSTPDPFYLNDPFYTEGAKQIESLVMYIVQTESLCNQLEVRRAQSRQLRVCCAQNKGEHKIWNDRHKKRKNSVIINLWLMPTLPCPYYGISISMQKTFGKHFSYICISSYVLRLGLSVYWIIPTSGHHSHKQGTQYLDSSIKWNLYFYSYALMLFIMHICSNFLVRTQMWANLFQEARYVTVSLL